MERYEIPAVTETTTPADAAQRLAQIYSDAAVDQQHPYSYPHHPAHKAFKEAMTRLHEIKGQGELFVSPASRAAQEALTERQADIDSLRAKAESEVAELVKLGFEPTDLPTDVQPWLLDSLRLQKYHAQGDYENLTPLLEEQMQALKAPPPVAAAFKSFLDANPDPALRDSITEQAIRWLHNANRQKHGEEK